MTNTINYFGTDKQWYLNGHGSYADKQLVTSEAHNEALGVKHIKFLKPDTTSALAPMANVKINLAFGITIDAAVYVDTDGHSLRLNIDQRPDKKLGADGKPARWYDIVSIPRALQAQVLRHADAVLKEYIVVPAARNTEAVVDPAYQAFLAHQAAEKAAQQAAVDPAYQAFLASQAAAKTTATAIPDAFNVEAEPNFESVSPEQIAAAKASGFFTN